MSELPPPRLATCVREVFAYADQAGWDQPPQLFALVPTIELAEREPQLAAALARSGVLTCIAQGPLPAADGGGAPGLDTALAAISWPDTVAGCALVQEILILPPDAEAELDAAVAGLGEAAAAERAAADPRRREARLVAAVLRDGRSLCLLQLRPDAAEPAGDTSEPELLEHPDLAPNLVAALLATLR